MHRPIIIAISLAASLGCTAPTPANESSAQPANTAQAKPARPARGANAVPADSMAATRPGEIKTFGDWIVGCDNLRNCKAVALAPDDNAGDWPAMLLSVERGAGAAGAIRIVLTGQVEIKPPVVVTVDGREVARGGSDGDAPFAGDDALRVARAIAAGTTAQITSSGQTATNSLNGASAALRYLDAQQGRAGTRDALVAMGGGRDTTVAAADPVIGAIKPAGTPARLTAAIEARLRKTADCGIADFVDDVPRAETHALGGGTTLVLLPCDRGAYNEIAALFVIGRDGRPVPARLDAETGMNPDPQPVATVVNPDFAGGVLSTYAKGRGLGDCGSTQSFVWDGKRLRLSAMAAMPECRGSIDYIPIWRAAVTRR